MNGRDLDAFIRKISSINKFFLGVFSINTLPENFPSKHFLICNYDLSNNPGSHWFCLLKSANKKLECFDSLGLNDEKKKLLQKYCSKWKILTLKYNETPIQNKLTTTCGKFVLYFAIQRMHNLDLSFSNLINEIFNENSLQNEQIVGNFLEKFD